MDVALLKDVLIDQHNPVEQPKTLVLRDKYVDLEQLRKSKQVVIISGLRRCGKSIVLSQIREKSSEKDYYINFDDDRLVNFELKDFQKLYELFVELYGPQKTFYFDEIQNILGWERFVRRLFEAGNKIYITGSNATLLSIELGTRLTGRYIETHLYPYSFSEFMDYKNEKININEMTTIHKGMLKAQLNNFITLGGLPEYLEMEQPEYLHYLYNSILYRDIIVRYKISDPRIIKELVYYLASNVGKEFSYNAVSKTLGPSSPTTISEYCNYVQDCFLCFFVHRFDYSLKKQIQNPKKIYFIDQALAVKIGFRFSKDEGRLLENIVFLELKRRNYEIFYHKIKKECDFVIREGLKIISAIQVCLDMTDPETKEREFAGMIEAMETYQLEFGLIITADTTDKKQLEMNWKIVTIKIIPISNGFSSHFKVS